ncbi:MAG: TonB-dependent receptor [Prevotellaceae bacterium]|jgi:iron complex outermembrane receptor protein|nr:TonB-dependent receptor [Prevotellaceae bacterium]
MKGNFFTFILLTFSILSISAQDTLKNVELQQIDVYGTRNSLVSEQLRVVYSISKEEIAALPVQDINELLDYLPSIDVRQRGANGTQADLSIRGGTFDQVLILLNGVNITDVQTGHYSLDLPITLGSVEKIEILQGTSMNIFGLSAFSGAVNIITGQTAETKGAAEIVAGDFGLFSAMANLKVVHKKWVFSGAVSHSSANGYTENTDYKMNNVFLQANFKNKKIGNFNFQIGAQTKDYGANAFYSATNTNQFDATKTLLGSAQWEKHFGNFAIEASAFYRRHHDRYEWIRNTPTGRNFHLTDIVGGNVKGAYFSKIGKTSLGVEVRNEHIFSTNLGDSLAKPVKIPLEKTDTMFQVGKNRLNINYFVEQAFFVKIFSASIGVSGNYNAMFGHNFAFGANVGYEFYKNSRIYLNVNRALRLPAFTDLYYKSRVQTSNPNLKPEENITAELGVKFYHKGFYTNFSAFYRAGKNIIDWLDRKGDGVEMWEAKNHTQINTFGGEIAVGYRSDKFVRNAEISYSYLNSVSKFDENYQSKYALDYLKHKLSVRFEHKIYKGFGASWQYILQERNGSYKKNEQDTDYQAFGLLDGRIFWQNPRLKFFIEATNILDIKYFDIVGIQQPSRWVKAGVEVRF